MPLWRHIAATAARIAPRQRTAISAISFLNQRISDLFVFGRERALNGGMLRITLRTASHSTLFILEGKLTGLWAKELLRVVRGTNLSCGNIFDLQEVFYVDSEGEEALTQAILGVRERKGIIVVVAHRPSAIAGVDRLLMMSQGRTQAIGPKDEILSKVLQRPLSMPRPLKVVPESGGAGA